MLNRFSFLRQFVITLVLLWCGSLVAAADLTQWQAMPATWKPAAVVAEKATLQNGGGWAYLVAPDEHSNAEVSATVTIDSAATQFGFFGSSWSAWPDPTFGDQGFDASLLLRADEKGSRGYRVQVSHKSCGQKTQPRWKVFGSLICSGVGQRKTRPIVLGFGGELRWIGRVVGDLSS